jgi:hypothetical protein
MPYKKKTFWFYRCVHCGSWYYSDKRIERKKCIRCNKSFKFDHAKKFKKKLTLKQAIAAIKKLKKPDMRELIQFATIPEEVDY